VVDGPEGMLLALDTSTATASVALHDGRVVVSETTWLAGREHSTRLLVEVEAALARVGIATTALTGLVVANGPGSFTGVRVALSVAKGIAAGLSLPLWGVSTLDVLAAAAASCTSLPIRAILEAGRGRYATALFEGATMVEPARGVSLDELIRACSERTLVIGELTPVARARLASETAAVLAPPAASLRRAGYLAELGWALSRSGVKGDPAAVDAFYLPPADR
jgi:tRNA threonylcarbamoyladenosine biosynthesis protein TsaB